MTDEPRDDYPLFMMILAVVAGVLLSCGSCHVECAVKSTPIDNQTGTTK